MREITKTAAILALMMTAAVPASLLLAPPASAQSKSERECAGVFDRNKGEVSCTIIYEDHVGNSDNSQSVIEEWIESSNGTLNNKPHHEYDEDCDGPGGSDDKSSHCKPN